MKLVRFVMRLVHETVTVELKNSVAITGIVSGVDISMNIHLKTVKVVNKDKSVTIMDTIMVRGSSIRDIILPDNLPLEQLLLEETVKSRSSLRTRTNTETRSSRGCGRGRGRGTGRGRGRGGLGRIGHLPGGRCLVLK